MIKDFEQEFIGGGEESLDMVGDAVRDKDTVAATLLICEVAAQAKKRPLTTELLQLYVENGFYKRILSLYY
jgi:phosphomannomutase